MWRLKLISLGTGAAIGTLAVGFVAWGTEAGHTESDPKAGVSASQQAALATGDVDAASAAAGDLVLRCLRERGVPAARLARASDGSIQFSWGGSDSRSLARSYG